jgi:hypothetical protein
MLSLSCLHLHKSETDSSTSECILIYIQKDTALHSLFYLETALHVLGGTTTHHQERKQLYLQHLVFVTPLPLSWKSWNWFGCAVGGLHHPQHTQTGSNSTAGPNGIIFLSYPTLSYAMHLKTKIASASKCGDFNKT